MNLYSHSCPHWVWIHLVLFCRSKCILNHDTHRSVAVVWWILPHCPVKSHFIWTFYLKFWLQLHSFGLVGYVFSLKKLVSALFAEFKVLCDKLQRRDSSTKCAFKTKNTEQLRLNIETKTTMMNNCFNCTWVLLLRLIWTHWVWTFWSPHLVLETCDSHCDLCLLTFCGLDQTLR